jgi:AraC-like DNA-binding protein
MENLIPLIEHAEPRLYYDFLNSYAVELIEAGRLHQAENISAIAVASPFGPYYREWQETLTEIRSRTKHRSTVSISSALEREYEPTPRVPISNVVQFPIGDIVLEPEVSENTIRNPRVKVVIDFMNTNLHRRLSLSELAKLANLSVSHLSRLFRTETTLSPWEYLIRLRMVRARELLATTLLSVKEVMAAAGYDSKSHFSRHFRRAFGVSPSEYRRGFLAQH